MRQQRLDAIHHADDVGAGLALNVENDRRHAVHPGGELVVLGAVDRLRDVAEPHRGSVPVCDHEILVGTGGPQLIVGIDRVGARGSVEVAFRCVHVGVSQRGPQVVDVQPIGRELARIGADAHSGALSAADADQPDAGKLRDFLREACVGKILDPRQRQRFRGERQGEDRGIRRIDLGIDRRRGKVCGQQIGGGIDRRLHFLLGNVEPDAEAELERNDRCAGRVERNDRCAGRADRAHLIEARHLAELDLERSGDR